MPAGKRIAEVAGGVSAGEDSPGFLNKGLELGSALKHRPLSGYASFQPTCARLILFGFTFIATERSCEIGNEPTDYGSSGRQENEHCAFKVGMLRWR